MKRPTTVQFVLANPIVGLAAYGGAGWVAYRWWHGEAAGLAVILAVFGLAFISSAYDAVSDYQDKQMEWAALSGQPYRQGFRILLPGSAKTWLGILIWIGVAFVLLKSKGQPGLKLALWLFAAGTAVGLLALVVRRMRARRPSTKKKVWRDVPVTQCLSAPSRSPSVSQTVHDLPENYATLIATRR